MATTSIWRVNGWLGKVLIYIENPDKTENPDFFEKQDMDGNAGKGEPWRMVFWGKQGIRGSSQVSQAGKDRAHSQKNTDGFPDG